MPIYGLTDTPVTNMADGLPIIADGFKGTERTPEDIAKKKPGKELPYFRIKFRPPFAHLQSIWEALYGATPTELSGALIGTDNIDDAFPTFNRVWAKTGILMQCDGKTITHEYSPDIGRTVRTNAECLHEQGKSCECKREGTLKLIFPNFSAQTGVFGVIRFTTHSFEDIVSIYRALSTTQMLYGKLVGVRFTLYREQGETSFFDKKENVRKKMKKWFMKVMVDKDYLKSTLEHRLGSGTPFVQLPAGDSPIPNTVVAPDGINASAPKSTAPAQLTWIATNGNMAKILTWAKAWFKMSPDDLLGAFQRDDPTVMKLEDYKGNNIRIRACALAWYANAELTVIYDFCKNTEFAHPDIQNDVKRLAEQFTQDWLNTGVEYFDEENPSDEYLEADIVDAE